MCGTSRTTPHSLSCGIGVIFQYRKSGIVKTQTCQAPRSSRTWLHGTRESTCLSASGSTDSPRHSSKNLFTYPHTRLSICWCVCDVARRHRRYSVLRWPGYRVGAKSVIGRSLVLSAYLREKLEGHLISPEQRVAHVDEQRVFGQLRQGLRPPFGVVCDAEPTKTRPRKSQERNREFESPSVRFSSTRFTRNIGIFKRTACDWEMKNWVEIGPDPREM